MDFVRLHPAHVAPLDKHNRPIVLHVTVVTRGKRPVLCSDAVHQALRQAWQEASQWLVGTYVIMPEHVHLMCAPGTSYPEAVRRWCGLWKRLVGQKCAFLRGAWVPDCWDTQIRNGEHYGRKLEYLRGNPVRRNLATSWDEWPYKGTLNDLRWLAD